MSLDNTLPNKSNGNELPFEVRKRLEELIAITEHTLGEQQYPGIESKDMNHRRPYIPGMNRLEYHNAWIACVNAETLGYDVKKYEDKLLDLNNRWVALYELNKNGNEQRITRES